MEFHIRFESGKGRSYAQVVRKSISTECAELEKGFLPVAETGQYCEVSSSMSKGENSTALVATEEGVRQWTHLKVVVRILEVNSLINCQTVKIFVVQRDMTKQGWRFTTVQRANSGFVEVLSC